MGDSTDDFFTSFDTSGVPRSTVQVPSRIGGRTVASERQQPPPPPPPQAAGVAMATSGRPTLLARPTAGRGPPPGGRVGSTTRSTGTTANTISLRHGSGIPPSASAPPQQQQQPQQQHAQQYYGSATGAGNAQQQQQQQTSYYNYGKTAPVAPNPNPSVSASTTTKSNDDFDSDWYSPTVQSTTPTMFHSSPSVSTTPTDAAQQQLHYGYGRSETGQQQYQQGYASSTGAGNLNGSGRGSSSRTATTATSSSSAAPVAAIFGMPNPAMMMTTTTTTTTPTVMMPSNSSTAMDVGMMDPSTQQQHTILGGSHNDLDDLSNEPPLLEELGVNVEHIVMKTKAVVIPFRRLAGSNSALLDPSIIVEDADLAGPLAFALLLGAELMLAGKLQFGYIYGFGMFGCLSITFVLNLMTPSETAISFWTVTSILGYALLPVNLLAAIKILLLNLAGFTKLTQFLALLTVVWSTTASTRLLEVGCGMEAQRYLLAYPLALIYSAFVLITLF